MESVKPKVPGLAITSLVLGFLGFIPLASLLTGIPAIVTGHIAQRKIKAAGGVLGGAGIALTGTIFGYITTVALLALIPIAALVTPAVFNAMDRAEEVQNLANGSQIHTALVAYSMDNNDQFPSDLDSLISSGHLSDPLTLDYRSGDSVTAWAYYPGVRSNDYSSIILAGPANDGSPPQRILVFVDGSARLIDEAEAQSKATAQGVTLP